MIQHNLISIDVAKNVFQVCSLTSHNQVTFNKSIKRKDLVDFMVNNPPVEIAMEACIMPCARIS